MFREAKIRLLLHEAKKIPDLLLEGLMPQVGIADRIGQLERKTWVKGNGFRRNTGFFLGLTKCSLMKRFSFFDSVLLADPIDRDVASARTEADASRSPSEEFRPL